jgi:small redox-active disulfide protein 2
MAVEVKVLGTGCPKCNALEDKVRSIAQANGIPIQLEKVKDIHRIMEYAVMMTPALVVNGEVKSTGRIPGDDDILKWLKGK